MVTGYHRRRSLNDRHQFPQCAARANPRSGGYVVINQPELGQLLAPARAYIESRQLEPVLVPAVTIALAAFSFELIGIALRARRGSILE